MLGSKLWETSKMGFLLKRAGAVSPDREKLIRKVLAAYKKQYGVDMSDMRFIEDPTPRFNNGKKVSPSLGLLPGGSWTKKKKIYLAPDLTETMKAYGITEDADTFASRIIAHELAHELYNNRASEKLKADVAKSIVANKFNTPYLKSVASDKYDEEAFAEYIANELLKDQQ